MALSQGTILRQLQKLSPQQIQLMKLLQVPTANLDQRIKEELEDNAALEIAEEGYDSEASSEGLDEFQEADDNYESDEKEAYEEAFDIGEYVNEGDDEVPDYKTNDPGFGENDEERITPQKTSITFHESLLSQLGWIPMSEREKKIAEHIIGSIDDDGLLRRDTAAIVDDIAFRQNIDCEPGEIESMIRIIQAFDPPGVAARDLKECLILQLERKEGEGAEVKIAIRLIQNYFEEFTKKHYEKIERGLGITHEQLQEAMNAILRLNPKPGGAYEGDSNSETYVVPDFFILNNEGKLELTLNSRNAPDLRISENFRDMLKDYSKGSKKDKRQKEAVLFIKQKIDAAKWFIDAIKQRQNTLLSVMGAIIRYQQEFFLTGDETVLRPMILKDIAERTQLDISTVSRVANSKFVQTEYGTYRLKFFFSESLSTESGEEVSTREVKKILSDLIESESKKKPLSDERLTDMLKEKGYNIARRTVAKYREQLNIPVARLRRKI